MLNQKLCLNLSYIKNAITNVIVNRNITSTVTLSLVPLFFLIFNSFFNFVLLRY